MYQLQRHSQQDNKIMSDGNCILLAVILQLWNFPSRNCIKINRSDTTPSSENRIGSQTRIVLFITFILMYIRRQKNSTHWTSFVVTYRRQTDRQTDRHSHNSITYISCKYLYINFYHLHSQNTQNNVIFTEWTVYCFPTSVRAG